ncbi:MAG: hypothetical protein JWN14_953 [Chthonomonadales bacterium]|nr:hypothetical protein [Chthonomonadales bacterium]
MLMGLGSLLSFAAFICMIIILIDAFKNEVWKGIVGLFCFLYLIYYGIVEYKAPNKLLIVGIYLFGFFVGGGLSIFGFLSMMHGAVTTTRF